LRKAKTMADHAGAGFGAFGAEERAQAANVSSRGGDKEAHLTNTLATATDLRSGSEQNGHPLVSLRT
jgi:hypothetical protein